MKKTLFLSVSLFLTTTLTLAQSNLEPPKLAPQNPEVAAFGKYLDTPVSLSSGVPSISVPLVELTGRELNIPVYLSYHAGGIRVSEIASRVGLGWNLNAGGAISRSVRGYPDDSGQGFLNPTVSVSQFLAGTSNQQQSWVLGGYENDYESDMYTYNLLGQSGKFFFKQDGTIVMHPKGELEITPVKVGTYIKSWIVTASNGTKYYLGKSKDGSREANDISTSSSTSTTGSGWTLPNPSTAMTDYITSWQLMDVETTNKELVSFAYASSDIEFWNLGGQEKEIPKTNGTSGQPSRLFYSINEDKTHRITSISNNVGSIEFIYDTNQRQDLKLDYALKEVQLKNQHNQLIDSYHLNHTYFISPSTFNNNNTFGDYDQRRKRLRLNSVKQTINSVTNKEYSFEYNTAQILPDRFSYAQDFWGYFNGRSNTNFYPTVQWPINGVLTTISGGDRKVYETHAKACVLTKVTYPTGGATEFEFESNKISNQPFIGTTNVVETVIDNVNSVGTFGIKEKFVTINNIENYVGGISWFADIQNTCSSPTAFNCPKAELYKYDGSQYVLISSTQGIDKKEGIQTAASGTVQLKIKLYNYSENGGGGGPFGGGGGVRNEIFVDILGYELPPNSNNAILAGGLRVKNVKTKDSDNSIVKQKDYVYTEFANTTKSSGTALNPPTFILPNMPFITSGNSLGILALLKSTSIYPLTNGGSYSTVYREVTELHDGGNEGKTESTFTFVHDGNGVTGGVGNTTTTGGSAYDVDDYIYDTPSNDFSHRRGVMSKQKVFKKDGSTYKILLETEHNFNVYEASNQNFTKNLKMGASLGAAVQGYIEYNNLSERYYKINQIQKTYDDAGLNPITQTITYSYDSGYTGRSFPTETQTTSSDTNKTNISKTLYADDVVNTSSLGFDNLSSSVEYPAILKLKSLNRITEPIQVETTIKQGATIVSNTVQRTNYDEPYANIVLPNDIQILKGVYNSSTNKLQDRLEFHSYYANGNVKEVSKKDGSHIVYIWGYNDHYPIAKIENATYSEVSGLVTNLQNKSNADNDHTFGTAGNEGALRAALSTLRNTTALADALVTTYTYDPQIGVTSVTNPTGQTIYYHYDSFNRLEMVTDKDNKVLSKSEYHYSN